MRERRIRPDDVRNVARAGEVIEEYADDQPYPCFVVLGYTERGPLHVIVARDPVSGRCVVVTVYPLSARPGALGKGLQDTEKAMKCTACRTGELKPGRTTVTLTRDETIVIVKGVPAEVCSQCGEYVLDETVADWISDRAESAIERGAEVEILRYAA